MNYLLAESLSKSYGERVLFKDINLSIEQGQKIALVARNGEGKTTLMRILAGKDESDGAGNVRLSKDIRMGYLPQEPDLDPAHTVLESVLAGGNAMVNAVKNYEAAMERIAVDDSKDSHAELENATHEMEVLKAWDYELKIRQILTRLNITNLSVKVGSLSGGQKKRVALAKVLIEEPELLLLDEPTNHLDMDMVEWLEGYLSGQNLALLLITHDRYFLDRVTNEILELEYGQLYKYRGNYTYYLEKKAGNEESQQKETEKSRNLLRKELEWMRRQPKARSTKSKARIDAFYDLEERSQGKQTTEGVKLEVKMTRMGGKIIEMQHVSKHFDELAILDDFTYIFQKKERIGLIGPNGIGKTTFLEMLTGRMAPDKGSIVSGETIVFGYYTQAGIHLAEDKRVIEVVTDIAEVIPLGSGENLSASQFLQRFGFEPKRQYTNVSLLSGGEKRRLHLLTVLVKNPNFLILDEPTNDLDIITLNTLEEFLMTFPGCLIIVSHDRYFLDKLADHLFIFEGKGQIKDYNGTYTSFRNMKEDEERAAKQQQNQSKNNPPAKAQAAVAKEEAPKKKLTYKEKLELEQLEKKMGEAGKKKAELEKKLQAGEGNHEDFTKWGAELEKVKEGIDEMELRWLELSEGI